LLYFPEPFIKISIIDSGIGMKKEELKFLLKFDENNFFSSMIQYNQEGSGLGLSISKLLAEKLDHKIGIESTYGEGSNFSLYIKAKQNKFKLNTFNQNNFDKHVQRNFKSIKYVEKSIDGQSSKNKFNEMIGYKSESFEMMKKRSYSQKLKIKINQTQNKFLDLYNNEILIFDGSPKIQKRHSYSYKQNLNNLNDMHLENLFSLKKGKLNNKDFINSIKKSEIDKSINYLNSDSDKNIVNVPSNKNREFKRTDIVPLSMTKFSSDELKINNDKKEKKICNEENLKTYNEQDSFSISSNNDIVLINNDSSEKSFENETLKNSNLFKFLYMSNPSDFSKSSSLDINSNPSKIKIKKKNLSKSIKKNITLNNIKNDSNLNNKKVCKGFLEKVDEGNLNHLNIKNNYNNYNKFDKSSNSEQQSSNLEKDERKIILIADDHIYIRETLKNLIKKILVNKNLNEKF